MIDIKTDADMTDMSNVLDSVLLLLDEAAKNRKSPMHAPTVATVSLDGSPNQRVMVLRDYSSDRNIIRFHTDARSPKVREFQNNERVSITAYDPQKRVQLKIYGRAELLYDGDDVTEAWLQTDTMGRRVYMCEPGSGSKSSLPISGISEDLQSRRPTLEESEAGRRNFAIILVVLEKIDWLLLCSKGNSAARFIRENNGWAGQWLIP